MTLLYEGKWQLAEAMFIRSLALDPSFAPASDGAGYAAIARGDFVSAIPHLRKAIALDSLYHEPREGLFFALYSLGREDEARQTFIDMVRTDFDESIGAHQSWMVHSALTRDPRESASIYEQAYAHDTTSALTIMLHGNALAAQGNFAAANQDWQLAYRRDPRLALLPLFYNDEAGTRPDSLLARDDAALSGGIEFAALRVMRGGNLAKLGRGPEAFKEFQRAAELSPTMLAPHMNMAVMLALQGQSAEAEREWVAAFQHRVTFTRPFGIVGDADANSWLQAWTQFTQAHAEVAIGWLFLGNAQAAAEDEEAALASHRRAVELAPASALAHLHLGVSLSRHEDAESPLPELAKALELDPSLVCSHTQAAMMYATRNDAAAVLAELAPVIRLTPRDVGLYRLQGIAAAETGKRPLAYSAFRQALAVDPGDALTHKLRAGVRQKAGDPSGAVLDLTRALQIAPSDAELHSLRAIAYRAAGNVAAAQADESALGSGSQQEGGGYSPPPTNSSRQMCSYCFGTGRQNCNFCYGSGSTMCPICNGRGTNYDGQACYNCRYSGFTRGQARCDNCQGSGKRMCNVCFGAGYVNR